ncbi:MAG: GPR endopeptidase [Clostridia bacterium]|nr:GPR endopeptidase [Clostridia bacterium]
MKTNWFTDLAIEAAATTGEKTTGVESTTRYHGPLTINSIRIVTPEGEAALGRPRGRYCTVTLPRDFHSGNDAYEDVAQVLAQLFRELLPAKSGCVLVVGLGNAGITPDALGPSTAQRILVTRHLTAADKKMREIFCPVASICPGVLGQTGLESAELVRGAVEILQPVAVIGIDALAAHGIERLCCTIQLTDTGLLPGGGIGNSRQELSESTLGVPVVGIGVPTVISADTLASDLQEKTDRGSRSGSSSSPYGSFYVAPKEMDSTNRRFSRLLADAVNLALQPSLTLEDLRYYLED